VTFGDVSNLVRLRKVKWKILFPFVVLTGLFAAFATRDITGLVNSSLEERLSGQLVSASQHTSDEFAKSERDQLQVVRTLAFTQGLAEALGQRDDATLRELVVPTAANDGIELAAVFDSSGRRVTGVRDASDPKTTEVFGPGVGWDLHSVSAVLAREADPRGDKWAEVAQIDGEWWLVSAGPISDREGSRLGVAVAGTRLRTLLRSVKREAFADITVFSPAGDILTSTFDTADAAEENGFLHGSPGSLSGGEVLGREQRFLTSDLVIRGVTAGAISVALPVAPVSSATQSTRVRMSAIFAIITVAVVVIGWFIARQLTGPLARLVGAAVAVTEGDLSARSNVRTGDEIGTLGVTFDRMAERLERQHVATIGALASAIDARDPYTAGHSVRVGDLSAELGAAVGMRGAFTRPV